MSEERGDPQAGENFLARVDRLIDELDAEDHRHRQTVQDLKDLLEAEIIALSLRHPDPQALARILYWGYKDVLPSLIASAFDLHVNSLATWVGPFDGFMLTCTKCGKQEAQRVTSRSVLKREQSVELTRIHLCTTCAVQRKQVTDQYVREMRARLVALKSMPYAEYLQTAEWKQRAAEHRRRAGHSCQVCNRADQVLNIHHRTYERRGAEQIRDLICLCEPCHMLFHENGRLAPHQH